MNTPKHHLSSRRRQRLVLWALAMLSWIASVLFAGRKVTPRQLLRRRRSMSLDGLKRMTIQLMIVRAAELARLRLPKVPRRRPPVRRHYFRSLLGSRLRRLMKRKDLPARIAVLIDVLRNLDDYAAILAKRLKRRLTRLFPIRGVPVSSALLQGAPAPQPACADTS
ncbi:MAG TPA: hypothetical protein VEA80_08355 [Vitreimonas sp.]|uniref:hypothetical protein n=1 Tax=Vitreimonas sp. TaxID=3069702 RepID=UPI002D61DDEE|nr:hypothetical protein [Vitreimonas sp.]HYD87470.1 hypothetical protein [Vitreimonas sp.]